MSRGTYRALLATPNYRALLITQFSGALNDNLYRMVASLFAVTFAEPGQASIYVALAGVLFIAPYLTLSAAAGRLVDSVGKRQILVVAKLAELLIMGLAMLAFFTHSITIAFLVLFLMAAQSTFFSPARYAVLPEIVARRDLSRANGLGEMSMFLAILLGSALGGAAFEIWQDHFHLAALPMITIAAIGLIASLHIRTTKRVHHTVSLSTSGSLTANLKMLLEVPSLGLVVAGLSLFWGLGAMAQYSILFYGRDVLALSETEIGLLQASLGLGIGLGCAAAGWLSGDRVSLGLSWAGMVGVGLSCIALGALPPGSLQAFVSVGAAGLAGGFFVVPVTAFMHSHSAEDRRGRLFATNNILNMLGVLLGIVAVYSLHDIGRFGPAGIFVVIGAASLAMAAASLWPACIATFRQGRLPASDHTDASTDGAAADLTA